MSKICEVCRERPAKNKNNMCAWCYASEVCGENLDHKLIKLRTIQYRADTETMNMSDVYCAAFRTWARSEIVKAYPLHIVEVVDGDLEFSTFGATTNDTENHDEIIEYCDRLWDRCNWDAVEATVRGSNND